MKKRRRATKKPYSRSIVGATLEVIQKKRSEKPEVRDAAREAALRLVYTSPFMCRMRVECCGHIYSFEFTTNIALMIDLFTILAIFSEIKERIKKTKDEKRAKKAEVTAKVQKSQGKGAPKGAAPKGPKLGGGGGKR